MFERPGRDGGATAVNQSAKAAYIRDGQPIIASAPLPGDGHLPPDTAAWWSTPATPI